MDLDWQGGGEVLREVDGAETLIRICYVKKRKESKAKPQVTLKENKDIKRPLTHILALLLLLSVS